MESAPLRGNSGQGSMPAPLPSTASVLVADDVAVNGKFMELSLRKFIGTGWHVQSVTSAEQALKAAQNTRFDLILMDEIFSFGNDSSMRGSEAVRRIRESEAALDSAMDCVPALIVLCSGNDLEPELVSSVGADAVWPKPFPSGGDGKLQAKLAQLFASRMVHTSLPKGTASTSPLGQSSATAMAGLSLSPSPLRTSTVASAAGDSSSPQQ